MKLGIFAKPNCKKRQLSLLVVNERIYPVYTGGMELATYHLIQELITQGHRVRALSAKEHAINKAGLPRFMELTYTTSIRVVKFFVFLIFGFLKMLRRSKRVDLFHGQPIFPSGLLVIVAGKVLHKPTILWARGADVYEHLENPFTRPIVRWTINGATRILALTEDLKKRIQRHCKDKSVSIVPNGVALPKRIRYDREQFLKKYGFSTNFRQKKIILFVGRLTRFKGLQYMLEAMTKIIRRDPDVVLLLIGTGREKASLKETCRKLGITKHVIFLGQISWIDVLKWLKESVLFVYPTLRGQGMNNAVLEAMASGLPVIATNVGGLSSIIISDENGILVNPESSESLAREVLRVISNLQGFKKMGRKAKKYVETCHSWKKVAKMYMKICLNAYQDFYSPAVYHSK